MAPASAQLLVRATGCLYSWQKAKRSRGCRDHMASEEAGERREGRSQAFVNNQLLWELRE